MRDWLLIKNQEWYLPWQGVILRPRVWTYLEVQVQGLGCVMASREFMVSIEVLFICAATTKISLLFLQRLNGL